MTVAALDSCRFLQKKKKKKGKCNILQSVTLAKRQENQHAIPAQLRSKRVNLTQICPSERQGIQQSAANTDAQAFSALMTAL